MTRSVSPHTVPAGSVVSIPESELRFVFSRSSGPGGQNVNKVSTRVTVLLDLAATTCLSEWQKQRVQTRLHTRVSSDGTLSVSSSKYRTQLENRRAAVEKLSDLITESLKVRKPRRATKPTQGSKKRRLSEKRQVGEKKAHRQMKNAAE